MWHVIYNLWTIYVLWARIYLDCKTVRIFARECRAERGRRIWNEREITSGIGERRYSIYSMIKPKYWKPNIFSYDKQKVKMFRPRLICHMLATALLKYSCTVKALFKPPGVI